MYLKTLSLTQFKNYSAAGFEFSPTLNLFYGLNGAGKTNLLDSIHYLCLGKSYFHAIDQQAIKHAAAFFKMEGKFMLTGEELTVLCRFGTGGKKEFFKNEVLYPRLTDHVGLLPVVMIAPDDHSLINEGSDERRRFLDNTISQINHGYLEDLLSYNKVLQQRNAALKNFGTRRFFDGSLIEALNLQMTDFAKKIFTERSRLISMLVPLVKKFYEQIGAGTETIEVGYDSVLQRVDLLTALRDALEKDRQLERTTEGIHRDELALHMNGQPLKKFGSQGQKKTFLMALKLAQWALIKSEKEKPPILLLDDLFDKMDNQRAAKIVELIAHDDFGQVFITDTNAERFSRLNSINPIALKYFHIDQGQCVTEKWH